MVIKSENCLIKGGNMKKALGSASRIFVSLLLFGVSLAMTQIPFAHEASAISLGWSQGGPAMKRLVDVSASNDGVIAYATENPTGGVLRKIWKSTDGGANWSELANAPSTSWGAIAVSGNGQIVFALSWAGADQSIYQSIDSGSTWTLAYTTSNQLNDIAISDDGNTVVVAAAHGILKSINMGGSFNLTASPGGITPLANWQRIDISADGSKIITTSTYRSIYKSTDGGAGWVQLSNSGQRFWFDIAISSDGLTILGVARDDLQGVWTSRDGGQTFSGADIGSSFAPVQAVYASMSDDGAVMLATSYGTSPKMSTDSGQTWSNAGLPSVGWMGFAISDTETPSRRIIAITERARVYSYGPIPAPTISMISPESGSTLGGNLVDINGDNFINVTGVSFGEATATSFEVLGENLIRAVAPPQLSGSVAVSVTTESGISTDIATYTFLTPVPPTLLSIFPAVGPTVGGNWRYLRGSDFRDIISVTVGGVESEEFNVISDSELAFLVPAGEAGTVDVVLTTVGGLATLSDAFSYVVSLDVIEMSWSGMSAQATDGDFNGEVSTVEQGPNGDIYILGYFENASGEDNADRVALWNGSHWVGLGSGINGNGALTCFSYCYYSDLAIAQNGDVYIAGEFDVFGLRGVQALAKWDGARWTSIAADIDGYISDLVFDNEGSLYVSGVFDNLGGISTADSIAKWDGTNWSGLGSDGSGDGPLNHEPYAMVVGSDDSLYISGNFRNAGGVAAADYLAVWNGATWSSVGTYSIDEQEFEPYADSLLIDNSSGADMLYIGGCMGWGSENLPIAKYDGTDWVALTGIDNIDGCVYEMEVAPSGLLVIAGDLYSETSAISGLAAWSNGRWQPLGNNQNAYYLSSLEITSDSRVIVSGEFEDLEGSESADYIAISQPIALLRNVGTSAEITPNIGTELGGTTVTLTGTHFSQATQVKFGTNLATDLTVVSADSISVTTPASAPGVVDVSIISPSGTQVFPSAFTYFEPVSSVVDTEEEVFLLPEQSITSRNQFVAGDSQTMSVPGFVPGERVQFILASTPQLLASTTADSDGVATFTFVFPRDVQGFHTLAVFAPVSARGMRQAIFIHPVGTVLGLGTLPKTGSEIQLWLPFVIAILGFLLITISGNRRRKIA
jgi:hypothetical protein